MDRPEPPDRRTFLKQALAGGVVAAASLAGCVRLSTPQDPGVVTYLGARFIPGSPVDRGVPILKVRVDDAGYVLGRPPGDASHLYCGQEDAELGADLTGEGDDRLRYDIADEKLRDHREAYWYADRIGEPVRATDFADLPYRTGASVRWRGGSDGEAGATLILLKLDPDRIQGAAPGEVFANDHDLVAFSDLCTHFCCRTDWHAHETARAYNAWDTMFCSCHNARFDPMHLEKYTFRLEHE